MSVGSNECFMVRSLLSLLAPVESGFSFREQERDGEAQAPVRAAVGFIGVILHAEAELDGLFANLQKLADAWNDWHSPLAVGPVVGGLGVQTEGGK